MRLFALIGYPLGHSFSKLYFTEKFTREGIADARYELFPLENIADLPGLLLRYPDLQGLNVTIPYKESVIPYLHALDETAAAIGAVNCIRIREGHLTGYNTDAYGFLKSVDGGRLTVDGGMALVLGTGGASKAVAYVLKKMGIDFKFVSRNPGGENEISYEALRDLFSPVPHPPSPVHRLIINTTPLGMAPNEDTCPDLPFDLLGPEHFVYDLVYNPAETLLLRRAKAQRCRVMNGLPMLYAQAERAWEIWNT